MTISVLPPQEGGVGMKFWVHKGRFGLSVGERQNGGD